MAIITKEKRKQEVKDRQDFELELENQEKRRNEAMKRVRVTRERVLKGIGFRELVDVPELDEGENKAHFVIRPLTDNEFLEVQKAMLGDMSTETIGTDLTAADIIEAEKRSRYVALSYALSIDNEKWTPKQIGELPLGIPEKLYARVAEISGFPQPSTSASLPKKKKKTIKKKKPSG